MIAVDRHLHSIDDDDAFDEDIDGALGDDSEDDDDLAEDGGDDEDELHELDGDDADLEPVLRDAVVPTLPFQPVCHEDCLGLCSECGARLDDDPDHHHEAIDPRWSALVNLTEAGSAEDEKRN